MAMQNLVSASLTAEEKTQLQKCLGEVIKILSFLTSLRGDEVRSLFKAGNGFAPFLDMASLALAQHPEIMPSVFPAVEFKKDYQLIKDLEPVAKQIEELAEGMQKTMIALASDTMSEALEIYHAVKQNADHVPGMAALASDMAAFFARPRKAGGAAKAAAAGARA
jgi:hypothetical protein